MSSTVAFSSKSLVFLALVLESDEYLAIKFVIALKSGSLAAKPASPSILILPLELLEYIRHLLVLELSREHVRSTCWQLQSYKAALIGTLCWPCTRYNCYRHFENVWRYTPSPGCEATNSFIDVLVPRFLRKKHCATVPLFPNYVTWLRSAVEGKAVRLRRIRGVPESTGSAVWDLIVDVLESAGGLEVGPTTGNYDTLLVTNPSIPLVEGAFEVDLMVNREERMVECELERAERLGKTSRAGPYNVFASLNQGVAVLHPLMASSHLSPLPSGLGLFSFRCVSDILLLLAVYTLVCLTGWYIFAYYFG